MKIFGEAAKVPASYKQITIDELAEISPDEPFAREAGDMFEYSSEPGYDGGDATLLKAADIRKMGVECPMMSVEEWMAKADWPTLLAQ